MKIGAEHAQRYGERYVPASVQALPNAPNPGETR
jgi:hypothetical protein